MTGKVYKTAMGKTIDMGALVLQNENTRAVGNMGVNARGDVLDSNNRPIDSKKQQVQRQYNRQVNTSASAIVSSARAAKQLDQESTDSQNDEILEDIEVVTQPDPVDDPTAIPKGGLAAAIAKSKEVKQELMKTPRQLAQEQSGIKKL